MKFNPFQKISLIVYAISLISVMLFIVPYKLIDYEGYTSISYDFLFSDISNIDFSRYLISLIIISFVFILIIKFNGSYGGIDSKTFNKQILIEKKVFIVYCVSLIFATILIFTSNFIYIKKINQIKYLKEKNEIRLIDYTSKKNNRIDFFNEMNESFNLSKYNNSVPKFWNRMNTIIKNNEKEIIDRIINSSNSKIFFNNKVEFETFIIKNNYDNYDVETDSKFNDILIEIEKKEKEINDINNNVFSNGEIVKLLVFLNLILISILYVLRPLLIFFGTIFKEKKLMFRK
jgi:hypothetical protein